ncbi:uncharacterized protein LOC111920549 isoform X1 [Lactuca sativa]|uniref:uncharacterized protein LOC111920549 isoform X1 n=2 Tax=Lactuca sativa TaxID=4236 RepID=UPI000CC88E51|nr:uncharacterized protein LOC111920549 isoform X1 [Lactuca sativa]
MAWRGSISRTLMSATRNSSFRSTPPPLPRLRPPQVSAPRVHSSRLRNPRTLGELGCAQSLMPMVAGARLTSHLTVNVRAFCELSHGTFCRSCQDR